MQRSNRRVLLTKMLLKEALLKLLQSKSIETINVSELCREADVNRATFYRHYNTPNDVLLDIGKELSDGMNRLVKRPSTVREAEEYVEKICVYLYEHRNIIKIIILSHSDSDFSLILNECYQQVLEIKNDFRGAKNLDEDSLKLISTFLAGGGYQLLKYWLIEDVDKTPQEIASLVCSLFDKDNLL